MQSTLGSISLELTRAITQQVIQRAFTVPTTTTHPPCILFFYFLDDDSEAMTIHTQVSLQPTSPHHLFYCPTSVIFFSFRDKNLFPSSTLLFHSIFFKSLVRCSVLAFYDIVLRHLVRSDDQHLFLTCSEMMFLAPNRLIYIGVFDIIFSTSAGARRRRVVKKAGEEMIGKGRDRVVDIRDADVALAQHRRWWGRRRRRTTFEIQPRARVEKI